jgi:hypothetical protein
VAAMSILWLTMSAGSVILMASRPVCGGWWCRKYRRNEEKWRSGISEEKRKWRPKFNIEMKMKMKEAKCVSVMKEEINNNV